MKKGILYSALILLPSFAIASTTYLNIPFENIPLSPNNVIAANYQFGNFSVIYCFENTFSFFGGVQWVYNGSTYNGALSQVTLVKPNPPAPFEGAFINAAGTIMVTNSAQNNPSGSILVVSCQFAY